MGHGAWGMGHGHGLCVALRSWDGHGMGALGMLKDAPIDRMTRSQGDRTYDQIPVGSYVDQIVYIILDRKYDRSRYVRDSTFVSS